MGSELPIALIAVAISILSLVVAAFSVGWNVYRDVILKARLKVSVGVSVVAGDAGSAGTFGLSLNDCS